MFFEDVEVTGGGVEDEVDDVEQDEREEEEDDNKLDVFDEAVVVVCGLKLKNLSCCCRYNCFLRDSLP